MKLYGLLFLLMIGDVWAQSGASVPRFAALRSKAVNTHVGPGGTYPISWRLQRQYMPVEIVAEFDTWRQLRDHEGLVGWVHKSLLTGRRHAMISKKNRRLFKKPDMKADVVAIAEPGTVGKLLECRQEWCRLNVQGYKGWIKKRFLWGVYPHEEQVK